MEFDKQYFEARESAVKWLRRDNADYREGVAILGRLRYKPALQHRLAMSPGNGMLARTLKQTLYDAVNAYRSPRLATAPDVVPAEVEVETSGTLLSVEPVREEPKQEEPTEAATGDTAKFRAYPPAVQALVRWYSKAYKKRDMLHKSLRAVGETNDTSTMERRRAISSQIDALTDYRDAIQPLKEAYHATGMPPTDSEMSAIPSFEHKWASIVTAESEAPQPVPGTAATAASLQKKDEDFGSMTLEQLRTRRHSCRSAMVRKECMLAYQVPRRMDKPNPMPLCPERTKIEVQVRALADKIYQIDKAIAKFG